MPISKAKGTWAMHWELGSRRCTDAVRKVLMTTAITAACAVSIRKENEKP